MGRPIRVSDEEILAVAREVFIERGPSVTLAAIASRLGLSQPALSQRFGSKRVLLVRALTPRGLDAWMARLEAGPDDRPFSEQLRELALATLEFFEETVPTVITMRLAGRDLLASVAGDAPLPDEVGREAVTAFFARARERGLIRAVDPQHAALVFAGGLQVQALLTYVSGEQLAAKEREALAAGLVDLVLRGIEEESAP